MGRLLEYVRGYYTVTAEKESAEKALELMMQNDVPFYHVCADGDNVSFRMSVPSLKKYLALTDGKMPDEEKIERTGLFFVASKYRMRLGFFIGAVMFAAILAAASLVVWDINIYGEKTVSEKEIESVLRDYGVYIGAFIPNINTSAAEISLAVAVDDISFASINLRGTVAEVIVHEKADRISDGDSAPSNLIAGFDGQIETVEVLGGMPVVSRGQIVRKGQLLVSGVIDSATLGYRLVKSRGNVYARTTLSFESVIPLKYEQKTYTGNAKELRTVKIFSKNVNLFTNNEIYFENYDTIESNKRVCLFGKIELPVFFTGKTLREYSLSEATRTEAEAIKLAYRDILRQSEPYLADGQILARYIDVRSDGGSVTMKCDVECIIDIGKESIIQTKRE